MKKFSVAVFIVVSAALLVLFIFRDRVTIMQNEVVRPKIVTPEVRGVNQAAAMAKSNTPDIQLLSFVPLLSSETLLNVLTAEINGDSYEDQAVLVRRVGSPYLIIIIGLYNPTTTDYSRAFEIQTGISQVKSFSFSISDITGTHVNSLMYSGSTDTGETEFRAYLPENSAAGFSLRTIAEFTSDSTIFVQQLQRSDPYFLSQTPGESFPVWVYSSDSSEGAETLDQIQTQYDWRPAQGMYVKVSENRMTGKRIEAKELERIQDGTQETFEKFLSGLWYMPQNTGSQIRYVLFNSETREIIFLVHDTQEVYLWSTSMLRRSGMYITSTNAEIESLVRRIDIALSASDEIKLKVNDDVAMIIGEDNSWDGTYKKMSGKTVLQPSQKKKEIIPADFFKYLQADAVPWTMSDNSVLTIKNNRYTAISESVRDSGIFAFSVISNIPLLQFRSAEQTKLLDGYYQIAAKSETQANKMIKEIITLTPVNVSVNSVFPSGATPITIERVQGAAVARAAAILGTK